MRTHAHEISKNSKTNIQNYHFFSQNLHPKTKIGTSTCGIWMGWLSSPGVISSDGASCSLVSFTYLDCGFPSAIFFFYIHINLYKHTHIYKYTYTYLHTHTHIIWSNKMETREGKCTLRLKKRKSYSKMWRIFLRNCVQICFWTQGVVFGSSFTLERHGPYGVLQILIPPIVNVRNTPRVLCSPRETEITPKFYFTLLTVHRTYCYNSVFIFISHNRNDKHTPVLNF